MSTISIKSPFQEGSHEWSKSIEWNTMTNWTESHEDTIYQDAESSLKVTLKFYEHRPLEHLCLYAKVTFEATLEPPKKLSYTLTVTKLGKLPADQPIRQTCQFKEELDEDFFIKNSFSSDKYFIKRYENVAEHFKFKMNFQYLKKGVAIEMEGESAVEALQNMFLDTESSDISILCVANDMQEIPCHKLILSSRSDVFKAMFKQTEMREIKDGILKIEDISAITMTNFLKYMYTDSLDDIGQIDCELLYAANKYNFKRLVSECLIYLRQTISDENVIEITKAAYLLDKDDLLLEAMNFLKRNGSEETKKHWNRLLKECPGLNLKTTNLLLFGE